MFGFSKYAFLMLLFFSMNGGDRGFWILSVCFFNVIIF